MIQENFPEELTEKMHAEFTIDDETEIKHKAGLIWLHFNELDDESKKESCKDYGITWEQALEWKDYFLNRYSKK